MHDSLNQNSIRKAAVLLRSLDDASAEAMFARLSPAEARAIRSAVRELGEVDPHEQLAVAEALRGRPEPAAPAGAVELMIGDAPAVPTVAAPPAIEGHFGDLSDADPKELADYLAGESPRTVALVLSYLPPAIAAGVLSELGADKESATLGALAHLGEASDDSLRVIASGLSEWIAVRRLERNRRANRMTTIRSIVTAAPADRRETILRSLLTHDPSLAEHLLTAGGAPSAMPLPLAPQPAVSPSTDFRSADHPATGDHPTEAAAPPAMAAVEEPTPTPPVEHIAPRMTFDEVEQLDAGRLATVMAKSDPNVLLLALAGASERMLQTLEAQLPRRVARQLRKRIHNLGPTRLSDIEAAQRAVAATAARLFVPVARAA
ncbi:Flagellar motor switch protein FliG [Pseudobythopirellula maris]|uniref:Flagellar motor switch protein FliG n=1 Tax=Pseudobythopirellula maris TaxID=2527991 RepID=A0A5C5ZGQ6_9BACT|nr:FliG C-terminal domain-containing protein [Pseudobythopirellula maris]TWT86522.1 Flagellar motor switch protein FliG [Pseudobythopirellula maris]